MRFWLFTRTCDWDEYCGFVVLAGSYEEALEVIKEHTNGDRLSLDDLEGIDITSFTEPFAASPQVILDSFKAG